jgi:hypothetical protein
MAGDYVNLYVKLIRRFWVILLAARRDQMPVQRPCA